MTPVVSCQPISPQQQWHLIAKCFRSWVHVLTPTISTSASLRLMRWSGHQEAPTPLGACLHQWCQRAAGADLARYFIYHSTWKCLWISNWIELQQRCKKGHSTSSESWHLLTTCQTGKESRLCIPVCRDTFLSPSAFSFWNSCCCDC